MWSVLRIALLTLSAATFAITMGASVAAGNDLRRELIGPPVADPSPWTEEQVRPPARWPPPSAPAPRLPCPRGAKGQLSGRLNLNEASVEDLQELPGVGPSRAARIVAFRRMRGPFRRVLDLRRVKGFGRKTVKKLSPYLTIDGESTLRRE